MGDGSRPEKEDTNTLAALALTQRPPASDPIPPMRAILSAGTEGYLGAGDGVAKRGVERVGHGSQLRQRAELDGIGVFRSTERLQHSAPTAPELDRGPMSSGPHDAAQGVALPFRVQGSQAAGRGEHNPIGAFAWTAGRGCDRREGREEDRVGSK